MTLPVKPMLCSPSTGSGNRQPIDLATLVRNGDWVLDTKLDGLRAIVSGGQIWNRRGVDITAQFPEIDFINNGHDGRAVWDGEIVAWDNTFETAAMRGKTVNKASIAQRAKSHPCRFVVFDYVGTTTTVTGTFERYRAPWTDRRPIVEDSGFAVTPIGEDMTFYDTIRDLGMEGVIAKRRTSGYQPNRRSPDWVKFKTTQRLTVLLTGYEPGEGDRKHMGAAFMTLIGPDGPVSVGRVGSGFTRVQTHEVKALIDAKEIVMAEVEALNLTSGGTLRFPVFRGFRTDLDPMECTTTQLDTLPRSGKAE